MSGRIRLDELTHDHLDALYDQLEAAEEAEAAIARVRALHRDAYAGTAGAGTSCTVGCGAWPCPTLTVLDEQPTTTAEPAVPVPAEVLAALVKVASHVSAGRRAADLTPYPDATARRALGALHDAGLLAAAGISVAQLGAPRPLVDPCGRNDHHDAHGWEQYGKPRHCPGYYRAPAAP